MHILRGRESASFGRAYCVPAEPAGFNLEAVAGRVRANIRDTFARLGGVRASGKAAHERYPLGNDYVCYTQDQALDAVEQWAHEAGEGEDYTRLAGATGKLIMHLASLHATAAGAGYWINKTPEISRFARELRESVGPCRIIYLVRDGLQVVASGYRLGWADVETLAFNWKGLLEHTREAMQDHPYHYLELRYEDLVRYPQQTLERTLAFCGMDTGAGEIVTRFYQQFGAGAFDTGKLAKPEGLDEQQIAAFLEQAGPLYKALGYPA